MPGQSDDDAFPEHVVLAFLIGFWVGNEAKISSQGLLK
jgi:hypothetical protein